MNDYFSHKLNVDSFTFYDKTNRNFVSGHIMFNFFIQLMPQSEKNYGNLLVL